MDLNYQKESMKLINGNLFKLNTKGHNIISTNINTINKNKIIIILINNTCNYSDRTLIKIIIITMTTTIKTITVKVPKKDQERKR